MTKTTPIHLIKNCQNKRTKRLNIHEYYIKMAFLASERSTCVRRKVGAILVDENNRVLSVGYNGNASKQRHCIDFPCPGAGLKSGHGLDKCEAIHAEISAIGCCREMGAIYSIYVTDSPCIMCITVLLATQCKNIYFNREYPHLESKKRWEKSDRNWIKIEM